MEKKEVSIKHFQAAHLTYVSSILNGLIFLFLFLVLYSNVIASQRMPNLYFPFIYESRAAIVESLQLMRKLPEYPTVLAMQKDQYGGSMFEDDVDRQYKRREKNISVLEQALKINPDAPEVLYELSVLYRENGNDTQAENYLKKALAIDPKIKNNL